LFRHFAQQNLKEHFRRVPKNEPIFDLNNYTKSFEAQWTGRNGLDAMDWTQATISLEMQNKVMC
jgi:hypothetical protein